MTVVASFVVRRKVGERMLFAGRGLVWLLIVSIVMRLRIDRVILRIVECWVERVMLLVFFVMT